MALNGQLPASDLAAIRGGRLRKDAAAAFNAMNDLAHKRYGRYIGIDDSYRPLGRPGDNARGIWDQWAAWERYKAGGNLAAEPGTSNHGWGTAIDVTKDGRRIIDAIGAAFGFSKAWSDAPGESWHILYQTGHFKPNLYPWLPLHVGVKGRQRVSKGLRVFGLTRRLQTCGYIKSRTALFTFEVERSVKKFQSKHHLAVDGVVGPVTWVAVKNSADWCAKHHRKEV